jgi:hypothetical protein
MSKIVYVSILAFGCGFLSGFAFSLARDGVCR